MAIEKIETKTPPYTSFVTFSNFIKGLQETGVPSRIDKSVLSKLSGAGQSALISSLKWLGLIDDAQMPTQQLEELSKADTTKYSQVLAKIMHNRYPFLSDGSLVIAKATGHQVEQKFRDFGISGSTIIKCVAFFIAAAKDAKIELGPHVKAPKAVAASNGKRQSKKQTPATGKQEPPEDEVDPEVLGEKPGFVKIHIPLHGMADGMVYLPDNLSTSQWAYALKITKFLLENYRSDSASSQKGDAE